MAVEDLYPHQTVADESYWQNEAYRKSFMRGIVGMLEEPASPYDAKEMYDNLCAKYDWVNTSDTAPGIQPVPAGDALPVLDKRDMAFLRIVKDTRTAMHEAPRVASEVEFDRKAPELIWDYSYSGDSESFYDENAKVMYDRSVAYADGSRYGANLLSIASKYFSPNRKEILKKRGGNFAADLEVMQPLVVGQVYRVNRFGNGILHKIVHAEIIWPRLKV